jgi:2-polyprenyl-3-methyl-5-hydroxy-6-metoxy-1,4-benzoquinol methylase
MKERYEQKHAGYYGQIRAGLLQYLPGYFKDVLDIGCGQGAFGALLKERFGCSVTGIEFFEQAAAEAANRLDTVLAGDAMAMASKLDGRLFDLIVLTDVLEHFPDPEALLGRYIPLLAPGGSFFLAVPNVRHWSVLLPLVLRGEWSYADQGILDETHLRFFTRRSLESILNRVGLAVKSCTMDVGSGTKTELANRLTLGLVREFLSPHMIVVAGRK